MSELTIIERLKKVKRQTKLLMQGSRTVTDAVIVSIIETNIDDIIKDLDKITEVSGEADRTMQKEFIGPLQKPKFNTGG